MEQRRFIVSVAIGLAFLLAAGQVSAASAGVDSTRVSQREDSLPAQTLGEVMVTARRPGMSRVAGAENRMSINKAELFKAACCNLGESFTTNPSVDVNYSDAATGAKQIKLLGLSGTYVQMLAENLPDWRGAALPFALSYVPGPWMKSIQVSKGASSVRNGYEGITGQIDVEYLKPEDEQGVTLNLYGNSDGRVEANADGNLHLTQRLNANVMAHYENSLASMDHNHDHFMDQPGVRQLNLQSRWDWLGERYIFHGGIAMLDEHRESGQVKGHGGPQRFVIDLKTHRYQGYMKHAVVLDADRGTNVALMASVASHNLDGTYGQKRYNVDERNAYSQLMFETRFSNPHSLSLGLSLNHDHLDQEYRLTHVASDPMSRLVEEETVIGAYGQYTFNAANDVVTLMAGARVDHSDLHGTFVTPRLHLRLQPARFVTLRLSVGKGYRTAHALAENNYLLASGRRLAIEDLHQEKAWNYGLTSSWDIPLWGKLLKINAECHHTDFENQMVIDMDQDPNYIYIHDLYGLSWAFTWQVDVSYPVVEGLELTVAFRRNIVKTTCGGMFSEKALTPRYKGLMAASYKTPLGLWEFDVTLQLTGGGRMPEPYYTGDGTQASKYRNFPAHCQLNAQVTRWFRHFSIYLGGENLTNYRQPTPIMAADRPWSNQFEPTMVWGPLSGAMAYLGIRINLFR